MVRDLSCTGRERSLAMYGRAEADDPCPPGEDRLDHARRLRKRGS